MSKKKDTQTFVLQASNMHQNKYDYSKSEYLSAHNKIQIVCPDHGVFSQRPSDHLNGKGCHQCANLVRSRKTRQSKLKTQDQFIHDCIKVHGGLYDYSEVVYQGSGSKVKISCSKHGVFLQVPSSHLEGYGCPKCAKTKSSKSENQWLDLIQ